MRVRDWMSPGPRTIGPNDRLQDAHDRMQQGGFRRLPVVDTAGRLLGIVTDRDLREHHGHLVDTRVTGAMVEDPVTVGPDDAIESVADLLLRRKIGGVPVVEADGRLVGILTETDLVRGLLGRAPDPEATSRIDVHFTAPTQTLSEAIGLVEDEGGTVLGVRSGDVAGTRTFRLHLADPDPARFADTLREHGFAVRDVRRA